MFHPAQQQRFRICHLLQYHIERETILDCLFCQICIALYRATERKLFAVEPLEQGATPEGAGLCKLLLVAVRFSCPHLRTHVLSNLPYSEYTVIMLPSLPSKLTVAFSPTVCRNKDISRSPCSRALLRTIVSSASETSSRRSYFDIDVAFLRDISIVEVETGMLLKNLWANQATA